MDCSDCIYWRAAGGAGMENCCHCLLDTGLRRVRDGDRCLSYEPKRKKRVSSSPPKTARRKAAEPGGGVRAMRA